MEIGRDYWPGNVRGRKKDGDEYNGTQGEPETPDAG